MAVLCVGEVLWDVFGARELLGGAPLNFASNLKSLGHKALLFSAVGADARGSRARAAMEQRGLDLSLVATVAEFPTGTAEVVTDAEGNASYSIPRPVAFDRAELSEALLDQIHALKPMWIYFGTLAQTEPQSEARLLRLLEGQPVMRRLYDINLRDGHWNLPLVQRLSQQTDLLKLNDHEAQTLWQLTHPDAPFTLEDFCRDWAEQYEIEVICVTQGMAGCAIYAGRQLMQFAGYRVSVADTVGAGDAFTAAYLHGFMAGWPIERCACFANALGALITSRAGATPHWTIDEIEALIQEDPTTQKQETRHG